MRSTAFILLSLYWRQIVLWVTPVALLPLLIISPSVENRCAYVVLIMAIYWVTEAIPLAVTSLIPVALFPALGVLSTSEVCEQYLKDTNMMFLGGLLIAMAVEHCSLHRRIALIVLMAVRGSPRFLLLGIMLTTMFLSMWITNLAATAMMIPIAMATLSVLSKCDEGVTVQDPERGHHQNGGPPALTVPAGSGEPGSDQQVSQSAAALMKQRQTAYLLGIAFSSTIGGRGTLPGASGNLVYIGILESVFKETSVTYATWMAFNVPPMLISTILTWVLLQYMHLGLKSSSEECGKSKAVRAEIRQQYANMGAMNFHQSAISFLFVLAIILWFSRDPRFMPGWAAYISDKTIKDATPAIAVILFLFVLPSDLRLLSALGSGHLSELRKLEPSPALLPWELAVKRVSWSVLILMGGSYAMSLALERSGLSSALGKQMLILRPLPQPVIVLCVMVVASLLTELASNAAVTSILLPITNNLSLALRINPIYLTLPVALAASFSFMLPVATPTNALVVSAATTTSTTSKTNKAFSTITMVRDGLGAKIICLVVTFVMIHVYGPLVFDLNQFPKWAEAAANRTAHLIGETA